MLNLQCHYPNRREQWPVGISSMDEAVDYQRSFRETPTQAAQQTILFA